MARGRVYRHDVRSPHCGSTLRRAQEDAQGQLRGWPTGLQLRRLRAALRARRGLSPSWAGDEGAGLGDIYGRERLERHWAGVGVRRSGGAGLGEKGGRIALTRLRERNERRRESLAARQAAVVVSFDEMWTYRGARRGDQREDCRIRTAVVREADGSRWVDLEVGDRSESPFLRLYERLPEAGPSASSGVPQRRLSGVLGMVSPGAARGGQRRGGEVE